MMSLVNHLCGLSSLSDQLHRLTRILFIYRVFQLAFEGYLLKLIDWCDWVNAHVWIQKVLPEGSDVFLLFFL